MYSIRSMNFKFVKTKGMAYQQWYAFLFFSNGHYIKRCSLPFHAVMDVTILIPCLAIFSSELTS